MVDCQSASAEYERKKDQWARQLDCFANGALRDLIRDVQWEGVHLDLDHADTLGELRQRTEEDIPQALLVGECSADEISTLARRMLRPMAEVMCAEAHAKTLPTTSQPEYVPERTQIRPVRRDRSRGRKGRRA